MRVLCIAPCGSKKIWHINSSAGATKAKDVYIGSFAKKCIEYAEKFHRGNYRILSAKYGFISPDFKIPQDYNVTFNRPSSNMVTIELLNRQIREQKLDKKYDKIIVLGGKEYVKRIHEVFAGNLIETPLSKCKGMGYMMQKMNRAIIKEKPLS
jgi:hypothetical protein